MLYITILLFILLASNQLHTMDIKTVSTTQKQLNKDLYNAKHIPIANCLIDTLNDDGLYDNLVHACQEGNVRMAELLLRKKIDLSKPNNVGKTPLDIAFENKHTSIAALFITHFLSCNTNHILNKAPFNTFIEKLLININDNIITTINHLKAKVLDCVSACSPQQRKAIIQYFYYLFDQKHQEIITMDQDRLDRHLCRSVCEDYTSKNVSFNKIELLVALGANPTRVGAHRGWTPMHMASANGIASAVQLFIKKGANINQITDEKETPLFLASGFGHIDTVSILIKAGANLETENRKHLTAFHTACGSEFSRIEIVQLFLDAKVNPNTSSTPLTPLLLARAIQREDIEKLLIKYGAKQ